MNCYSRSTWHVFVDGLVAVLVQIPCTKGLTPELGALETSLLPASHRNFFHSFHGGGLGISLLIANSERMAQWSELWAVLSMSHPCISCAISGVTRIRSMVV